MKPIKTIEIKHSARQWRRDMLKGIINTTHALTELILNSLPSYQRLTTTIKWRGSEGYQVVQISTPQDGTFNFDLKNDQIFSVEDLSKLKDKFATSRFLLYIDGGPLGTKKPDYVIDVLINRSKRGLCVRDMAEGLDAEDIAKIFRNWAGRKESHATSTRSLFGRGAIDVLGKPQEKNGTPGSIVSHKNGIKTVAEFSWLPGNSSPSISILKEEKSRKANQTNVFFYPKTLPLKDTLYAKLSNFFLLRNVNEDSSINLRLAETSKDWKPRNIKAIEFKRPKGILLAELEDSFQLGNSHIGIVGELFSARDPLEQKGKENRVGGLLVQDGNGTILDLTLFSHNSDIYASKFFGSVILTGAYELIAKRMDQHVSEEILLQSREGLNTKHDFYKKLAKVIDKWLEPYVEEEKQKTRRTSNFNEDASKRINRGLDVLNNLAKDMQSDSGPVPGPLPGIDEEIPDSVFDNGMAFVPDNITIQQNSNNGWATLMINNIFEPGDKINIVSENTDIIPSKSELIVPEFDGEVCRIEGLKIKGEVPGSGLITASIKGNEAHLKITITEEEVIIPNNGLEFKPYRPSGKPLTWHTAKLYANVDLIQPSLLTIVSENDDVELKDNEPFLDTDIESIAYPSRQGDIAVFPFKYRGNREGAKSRVYVEALNREGDPVQAECFVKIRTVKPIGAGIFKNIAFDASDDDSWSVYFERNSGEIVINLSFPPTKYVLGGSTAQATANMEQNPVAQTYLTDKISNFCVWYLLQEEVDKGTMPKLSAGDMYQEVNKTMKKIGLSMYENMVDNSKIPEQINFSEIVDNQLSTKTKEVLHEDVDVPENLDIPEELVWLPSGEITMRNINRMEVDKTGKYWRIIFVDKNTGETKNIKHYNNFQVELLWRYIVEEVSDFENVEGDTVMISFNDIWNIGESISKLDPRIWGDKASLPDSEKRWELQSLFYLCTALNHGKHKGKQNRAEFDFPKLIMQESRYEWGD